MTHIMTFKPPGHHGNWHDPWYDHPDMPFDNSYDMPPMPDMPSMKMPHMDMPHMDMPHMDMSMDMKSGGGMKGKFNQLLHSK